MTDNLTLWKAVERTDPTQVKAITGKPYKGSSPKPYYLIQKATETFGPCGIGWGFEIVRERVEDGSTGDKVHIAHVRVWYVWQDKRGQVEHVGQTMFAGKNKNGPYTDEDAPKKSVTDALVKALSLIGFAGDIFMGRYDDSKYVSEITNEIAAEKRNAAVAPAAVVKTMLEDSNRLEAMIQYIDALAEAEKYHVLLASKNWKAFSDWCPGDEWGRVQERLGLARKRLGIKIAEAVA